MFSRWFAATSIVSLILSGLILGGMVALGTAAAETRPRYGGSIRVEVRFAGDSADPPQTGPGLADLVTNFTIAQWDGGKRAVYEANDAAPGGRPYLDRVEVELGRSLRDQSTDLELGKTDLVELGPNEIRRPSTSRKLWTSAPVRVWALVFGPRIDDARVREALSLAVDRSAIHRVLLQQQGEISGAILPQWLSGYAFLFPAAADIHRARSLTFGMPAGSRSLTLAVDDAAMRATAERIALSARDAGLTVTVVVSGTADVRLTEIRIVSNDPGRALMVAAAAVGVSLSSRATSTEALYAAEKSLLEGFRVIPLFHLPDVYGAGSKVRGGPGISPLGEWRFENLWLEGGRP